MYGPQGLTAFALYAPSNPGLAVDAATLAGWVEDFGVTMTVLADWDGAVYEAWALNDPDAYAPYPREYVLGRDGRLVYVDTNIDVDALTAAIEAALATSR